MSAIASAAANVLSSPPALARALGRWLRLCALVALAGVIIALAYLTWIRDLPVFAIDRVEVTGTDDGAINDALTRATRTMTTLHADPDGLERVAAAFPVVASVRIETDFPSAAKIVVTEHTPIALVEVDGEPVPVAGDGSLLPGVRAGRGLPSISGKIAGERLTGRAAGQAKVLGAAPAPLLALVETIQTRNEGGAVVVLEGGVEVRFGTPSAADRKWAAAAAVIADERLTGLAYIDVSAPERPAVGGALGGEPIELEIEVAPVTEPDPATETAPPATETTPEATETAPPATETAPVESVPEP